MYMFILLTVAFCINVESINRVPLKSTKDAIPGRYIAVLNRNVTENELLFI